MAYYKIKCVHIHVLHTLLEICCMDYLVERTSFEIYNYFLMDTKQIRIYGKYVEFSLMAIVALQKKKKSVQRVTSY